MPTFFGTRGNMSVLLLLAAATIATAPVPQPRQLPSCWETISTTAESCAMAEMEHAIAWVDEGGAVLVCATREGQTFFYTDPDTISAVPKGAKDTCPDTYW